MKKRKRTNDKLIKDIKMDLEPYLVFPFISIFCEICKEQSKVYRINTLCKNEIKRIGFNECVHIKCLVGKLPQRLNHQFAGFPTNLDEICTPFKNETCIKLNNLIFIERKDKLAMLLTIGKIVSAEISFIIIKFL